MADSFVFYRSFYDSVSEMDERTRLDFLEAIIRYALYDEEIVISGCAKALFTACKPQIDANKKRRENGKYGSLGGRPKKNDTNTEEKPIGLSSQKPIGLSEIKPNGLSDENPNVNVNVNANANANVNDNVDYPSGLLNNIIPSDKGHKRKDDKSSQRESRIPKAELEEIVARWNTLPEPIPRLTVLKPGTKRYESLSARYDEYGADNIMMAIEKIRKSSFLCGKSTKWFIKFDWFVLPNNFPKVLEGNYADSEAEQEHGYKPSRPISIVDEMIEKGLLPR